jgi:ABC-2 type transport system permease protein/oleandomycin transport system permease protein
VSALSAIVSDTAVITSRNLWRLVRTPRLLVFATVQPVMFVLLFVYVFGGAIHTPGLSYVDYLFAGILVLTSLFGGTATTVGLAEDLGAGMIDRFRSLPMSRSAVLAGRTFADLVRNLFVLGLMLAVGTAVGFRFHGSPLGDLAALALVLVFGYAFLWVFAAVALLVRDPETAQIAGLLLIFPLIFASSAFVPPATMPHWLRVFANHQPVSITVSAIRALTQGAHAGTLPLTSLAWAAGILLVAVPLAVTLYRRA